MDITPIYELKTRLRAAAVAGTSLLSEDFRLKKAAESFAPLSSASPVFAKINEMTGKLIEDGSPESLLDTITLVDAVITTLGTVGVSGELTPLEVSGGFPITENVPYSRLSAVIDALTTTGSGNYNTVVDMWNENPAIFRDYRVIPALVKGLNASYSELADTVAKIFKGLGKELVPLIKKDFDPKGKKEMIRRLDVIEELCGAEENEFYLEQLENAEKDVRRALIYALRHDESNADKLIELTKTEKGKLKTTALAALMSFDCEKSAEFFNEYSKKKPVEVIPLLKKASSKWTSELAARLINELLVDDKGNKITFSQSADVDKVKLKAKTDFWELNSAMWGKWGAEIENIYREFDNKEGMVSVDTRLGETILVTNDEGLKALAIELNSAKATKNGYVFAETVTRLLGKEDSSKWIAEQIKAAYKLLGNDKQAVANSRILRVLRKIIFKDGKYYLENTCYDPISEGWIVNSPREITQSLKGAVSDALTECSCWEFDRLLSEWLDEEDTEYCEKLGQHFQKNLRSFSGTGFSDVALWCNCIKRCGLKNVKNLAVDYFKNIKGKGYTSWVQRVVQDVPGDDKYRLEEARAIIEIARKKKYDWFDVDKFEEWANYRFSS